MRSLFASSSRPLVAFRALVLAGFIGLFPFLSWGDQASDDLESREEIEFNSETLHAVTNLARSISGLNASPVTVDDNVATILQLLQYLTTIRQTSGGSTYAVLRDAPMMGISSDSQYLGYAFVRAFTEDWNHNSATLPRESSLLFELQRAIYGQAGIPLQSQSLLPVLWRMESTLSAFTNHVDGVDMSWTNALPALVSASTNLNLFFDGARDMVSELQTFGYQMADFFDFNPGSNLNDIRSDTADINSILSTYVASWDSAYDLDDQSWRVQLTYDGGLGDRIGEIAGAISDSNGETVDALDGIRDLLRMISTNVAATHDDIYGASQEESNISDIATDGADDYDYAVDSASSDIEDTLDFNEPDFEVHYTDNPLAPLANAVDFTQTLRSKMPDMSQVQTSSRVYLFKTEWDREHLLTRPGGSSRSGSGLGQGLSEISFDLSGSDPHVPNELLSYAATAMAWAWNLAAAVTAFYLFRQFWDWVTSWRV